jgi:hypothetical protein
LFPLQASGSGPGEELDLTFPVDYFPLLIGVVEFDTAGPGDLESAEFMQRENFGPEALSGSIEFEEDLDVHDFWLLVVGILLDCERAIRSYPFVLRRFGDKPNH